MLQSSYTSSREDHVLSTSASQLWSGSKKVKLKRIKDGGKWQMASGRSDPHHGAILMIFLVGRYIYIYIHPHDFFGGSLSIDDSHHRFDDRSIGPSADCSDCSTPC